MNLPGYDAWKLMSPEDENPQCEFCGASEYEIRGGWQPKQCDGECGRRWRDPDHELEAMRDDR